MDWEAILTLFVTLIISLTVHEAAHAWFALLGGDPTAYHGGQVTLNPIPHMQREPFGMVLLPLAMLLLTGGRSCFGYAHAPIDPYWAARHPKKAALMSAAGPLANLLLVAIAWGVMFVIGRPESVSQEKIYLIARGFYFLNLILAIFNLIPFPPLDGAGIVRGLAPATGRTFDKILSVPFLPLVVFIFGSRYLIEYAVVPVYYALGRLLPHPPWLV